jgi:hypothetical protein
MTPQWDQSQFKLRKRFRCRFAADSAIADRSLYFPESEMRSIRLLSAAL